VVSGCSTVVVIEGFAADVGTIVIENEDCVVAFVVVVSESLTDECVSVGECVPCCAVVVVKIVVDDDVFTVVVVISANSVFVGSVVAGPSVNVVGSGIVVVFVVVVDAFGVAFVGVVGGDVTGAVGIDVVFVVFDVVGGVFVIDGGVVVVIDDGGADLISAFAPLVFRI